MHGKHHGPVCRQLQVKRKDLDKELQREGSRGGFRGHSLGHLLHGMLGEDKARWELSAAAAETVTLFSPPIPAPPPPPLLSCLQAQKRGAILHDQKPSLPLNPAFSQVVTDAQQITGSGPPDDLLQAPQPHMMDTMRCAQIPHRAFVSLLSQL